MTNRKLVVYVLVACIVQYYENVGGLQIRPLFFCSMQNICVKMKDSDIRSLSGYNLRTREKAPHAVFGQILPVHPYQTRHLASCGDHSYASETHDRDAANYHLA